MLIAWAWVMCPSQNWAGLGGGRSGVRSLHKDHEEVIAQRKNHSAIIRRRGMDTGWASLSKKKKNAIKFGKLSKLQIPRCHPRVTEWGFLHFLNTHCKRLP